MIVQIQDASLLPPILTDCAPCQTSQEAEIFRAILARLQNLSQPALSTAGGAKLPPTTPVVFSVTPQGELLAVEHDRNAAGTELPPPTLPAEREQQILDSILSVLQEMLPALLAAVSPPPPATSAPAGPSAVTETRPTFTSAVAVANRLPAPPSSALRFATPPAASRSPLALEPVVGGAASLTPPPLSAVHPEHESAREETLSPGQALRVTPSFETSPSVPLRTTATTLESPSAAAPVSSFTPPPAVSPVTRPAPAVSPVTGPQPSVTFTPESPTVSPTLPTEVVMQPSSLPTVWAGEPLAGSAPALPTSPVVRAATGQGENPLRIFVPQGVHASVSSLGEPPDTFRFPDASGVPENAATYSPHATSMTELPPDSPSPQTVVQSDLDPRQARDGNRAGLTGAPVVIGGAEGEGHRPELTRAPAVTDRPETLVLPLERPLASAIQGEPRPGDQSRVTLAPPLSQTLARAPLPAPTRDITATPEPQVRTDAARITLPSPVLTQGREQEVVTTPERFTTISPEPPILLDGGIPQRLPHTPSPPTVAVAGAASAAPPLETRQAAVATEKPVVFTPSGDRPTPLENAPFPLQSPVEHLPQHPPGAPATGSSVSSQTALDSEQPVLLQEIGAERESAPEPAIEPATATGARFPEGLGQSVRVEPTPVTATHGQEVPEGPRAVPVPPEQAARLLGRPLPPGTVLLQLHPPELGYLQVQVQLTDNQLSAAFWADSSEVRALLQTHLPTLQQNLSTQSFPTHYVSTTLAGGDFSGQAGQFAQQHAASQSFAHDRDHSASRGANQHLEIDRVTYRLATRNGLLDVVI